MKVTVTGEDVADELRSLWTWLVDEEELRGRARLVEPLPTPGTLGVDPQALVLALGPGGAIATFTGVLIAWLRQRTSEVTVRATRDDGRVSIEVSIQRLRSLDPAGLERQILTLKDFLSVGTEGTNDDGTPSPTG